MVKVGFIGTGVMGTSIIKNMREKGLEVSIYSRTKSKAQALIDSGVAWYESPQKLVEATDLIFTMVGFPSDVEAVYFGENGIFQADIANKILVDLTTSTPILAEKIYTSAKEKNAAALDAPVSGGDLGAKNGTLTIMVGGDNEVFEKILPVFETFGKTIVLHGSAGKGQHSKMANQIMIAGTMTGMTEMLVYAKAAGLNLDKVIHTVSGGSASNWSLSNYAPRVLKEDYSPGFFVKHFIKDLKIALDEAKRMDLELPATQEACKLYEALEEKGYGDDGTQALIKLWWA